MKVIYTFIILLVFLTSGIYAVGLVNTPKIVPMRGIIISGNAKFGISWNAEGTQEVTAFDFGDMPAGVTKSFIFYIINGGEAMTASLYWGDTNWISNPNDMTLTWDLGNKVIPKDYVQKVTLQLTVNKIIGIDSPSFKIHIDGNLASTTL